MDTKGDFDTVFKGALKQMLKATFKWKLNTAMKQSYETLNYF